MRKEKGEFQNKERIDAKLARWNSHVLERGREQAAYTTCLASLLILIIVNSAFGAISLEAACYEFLACINDIQLTPQRTSPVHRRYAET